MKAAVQAAFGSPDVINVEDVPAPVPRDDEVLVRVHASVVGVVDSLARRGSPAYARIHFGLRRPRFAVLGCDFAGTVAATGPAVSRFAVGDSVFGTIAPRFGAHAEYVCLSEQAAIAAKPGNMSYAGAAALVDATALCFLRDKARLGPGQTIAINGASGAVGTAAVQLAKHFGATVTAVCGGRSADLVRKLGADAVIDYADADFARAGQTYDVIFDVAGKTSFAHCLAALSDTGIYLTTAPSPAIFVQMPWTARFGRKKAAVAFTGLRDAAVKRADLLQIAELTQASALIPVIDATYPLDRIVDAHRHVDAGHKQGSVIVTIRSAESELSSGTVARCLAKRPQAPT
jgi:NADPH:quinone reductase-like Zn-dependent oxidoreductase